MSAKETYREFCKTSSRPLIFQTPLWLDAVVGADHWDVILSYKGEKLIGAMPYVTSKKYGLSQITMPLLTFYMGPIILYPDDLNSANKHSFQRKVISDIVSQIPKTDRFVIHTDFEFDYWLPFYWENYTQTTRYSYILDTKESMEDIQNSFKPSIKKSILKATEKFHIRLGIEVDQTYMLYENDYHRKGLKTSFALEDIQRIDLALSPNNRLILEAVDSNDKVIAAFYLILDRTYLHYIFGAVDQNHRDSGVMSLLMLHAIKEAKSRGLKFNFGGSMNKNIEQFFIGFKGQLTPYFRISKVSNRWLKHFTHFQPK